MSITFGHSTKFLVNNIIVAQVVDVTPPNVRVDDIDISNMDSPDQAKEYVAGWLDGGEVEITLQMTTEANALYAQIGLTQDFGIQFQDGTGWTWSGYIKAFGHETEREGVVTNTVTVKVSGKPVLA
jgi:hypothetical protein